MPEIAFYIGLKNNRSAIEGAELDKGNPGVGGTQYLFLITVIMLNRLYGSNYALLLTDVCFSNADRCLVTEYAENEGAAIRYCEKNNIDNLVINANAADRVDPKIFETTVDIMLWAHNTLSAKRQRIAANTKSIKWVVCVSESQFKNMKDTPCFGKCTFINNVIPEYFYDHATLTDYSEEKAAYVGSLMPQKGAHDLIEIWRTVEKKCPHAQLYIFGGANLWNENIVLGGTGAADVFYDRILKKRLKKLAHPENIHFMGAKGWEYIDKFVSTFRLGIVNPSHYMRDETFCLSAVEMAAHGLPVISRQRYDGLQTTIIHGKNGYLEKSNKEIAKRMISVLSDPNESKKLGSEGRNHAKRFVARKNVTKWYELAETTRSKAASGKKAVFSKDSAMLRKDFRHKIAFLIESGKCIYLLKKKLRLKK